MGSPRSRYLVELMLIMAVKRDPALNVSPRSRALRQVLSERIRRMR